MNDESSLFLQTLKNVKRRAFLLAQLTNTINTIHKRSGCKSENICVIIPIRIEASFKNPLVK